MLEGREIDGKIGDLGGYFVDLDDKGNLEVGVSVKVNLLDKLKELALKSNAPDWLKKLLGA